MKSRISSIFIGADVPVLLKPAGGIFPAFGETGVVISLSALNFPASVIMTAPVTAVMSCLPSNA